MFRHVRISWFLTALLAVSGNSSAVCPISGFYLYVGDTASDGQCNYDDIQVAINNASATCRTNIVITPEHTYTTQHLEISGKSIALIGSGNACNFKPGICDPTVGCGGGGGGGTITLHGNGAASVLYIHGNSHVTLQSLVLTGGGGIDYGGGVHFSGTGALTLVDSTITANSASYGGGIQFSGSGGNATLTLGAGTIIDENSAAHDGGGIEIDGTARLFALAPDTFIGYNHAPNGFGGGIAVAGPARADIGSSGYNGAPVIEFNDANDGGGISVAAGGDGLDGTVRLFTTDPGNPLQISGNSATANGGGIYAKSASNALAIVCAFNYRIDDNIAAEGAAVYLDSGTSFAGSDVGSVLELNADNYCGPESPASLGSVACAHGAACNEIDGNASEDGSGQPGTGAVILVGSASSVYANRLIMRQNAAANLVKANGQPGNYGSGVSVFLYNVLFADNHTQHELLGIHNEQHVRLRGSTVAHNLIDNGYALYVADMASLDLEDSIIDMPGSATLDLASSPTYQNIMYVLSNDTSTLPASPTIVQGEPAFVDTANGDYHLRATSLGVDFAPSDPAFVVDLDGLPRDVDLATVPNFSGPRDLGAYERQNLFPCGTQDSIFCNGYDY